MMLLSLMIAIWRSFYVDTLGTTSALRLVTRPQGSSYFMLALPSYYEKKIRSLPGVVSVTRCNLFAGLYRNERSENVFAQLGTDPKAFLEVHPDYRIAPDQAANWESDPAGAIADRGLAEKNGWKVGDRLTLIGSIVPVKLELTIRGIFDPPISTQAVIFNWQYVEHSDHSISGRNNLFLILTDSPQSMRRVASQVDNLFHNSAEPTRTETEKAFELEFLEMLGNVKAFIAAICMAALFTTTLVCANTMGMSHTRTNAGTCRPPHPRFQTSKHHCVVPCGRHRTVFRGCLRCRAIQLPFDFCGCALRGMAAV
jgi:putative ABC transport system permease protein